MEERFGLKQLGIAFVVCMTLYFSAFYGIEHLRNRKGPWQISFTAETGTPVIVINQHKLGIHNVKLTFPGGKASTNATEILSFAESRPVPFDTPYGQCVFFDPISLPGNVTLKIFGHQIQLLPRMLTIDGKEQAWKSDSKTALEAR